LIVAERRRALYGLNPMTGVVEGFRWALLDAPAPPEATKAVSTAVVALLFVGDLFFFLRMELAFTDVV
jgi:lipopolysaccharide transport system permease protein